MAWKFDPRAYGASAAGLIESAELPELGPGTPRRARRSLHEALDDAALFGQRTVRDREMAECCRSGLWLLDNFLDESHRISQSVGTPSGSYWHGIMHRREPDYSNAKYWFRRVGDHPVFSTVYEAARSLADRMRDEMHDEPAGAKDAVAVLLAEQTRWDPAAFVDVCRQLAGRPSGAEMLARRIALVEWQVLFDYCWRRAVDQAAGGDDR